MADPDFPNSHALHIQKHFKIGTDLSDCFFMNLHFPSKTRIYRTWSKPHQDQITKQNPTKQNKQNSGAYSRPKPTCVKIRNEQNIH